MKKAFEIITLYQSPGQNGSSNKTMKHYIVISTSTPRAIFAFKKTLRKNEEVLSASEYSNHEVIIDGNSNR